MVFELRMITLAVVAAMFAFFIILLRRQKLELKYCLIWLVALIGIAVFCIFPDLLANISFQLGIVTPSNAFFMICIAFLACICISLTVVVSTLSNRLRELAQKTAIADFEKMNKEKQQPE